MKRRVVILAPEAIQDQHGRKAKHRGERLHDWIAESANAFVADGYVDRIESFCRGFDLAAERGHKRDDLRRGVRVAGFERRVTIAFTIDDGQVTILRVFYGGQDYETELSS